LLIIKGRVHAFPSFNKKVLINDISGSVVNDTIDSITGWDIISYGVIAGICPTIKWISAKTNCSSTSIQDTPGSIKTNSPENYINYAGR